MSIFPIQWGAKELLRVSQPCDRYTGIPVYLSKVIPDGDRDAKRYKNMCNPIEKVVFIYRLKHEGLIKHEGLCDLSKCIL